MLGWNRKRWGRGARPAAALAGLAVAGLGLGLAAPARAQGGGYVPCLGCAEHSEMQTRWHRPFLTALAGESLVMFDHFRMEGQAERLGLCETDPLIRSPLAVDGCHAYSARRAWLLEAPLEILAFTSPAWGLERRGHPRWALALELAPMAYHGLAIRRTTEAIHQWQRWQTLYH